FFARVAAPPPCAEAHKQKTSRGIYNPPATPIRLNGPCFRRFLDQGFVGPRPASSGTCPPLFVRPVKCLGCRGPCPLRKTNAKRMNAPCVKPALYPWN